MLRDVSCWENKGPIVLSEILDWCLREHGVDTLLVTSRAGIDKKRKASFDPAIDRAAKSIFGKQLIKRFNATGWPGTKLTGDSDRVYVVRFDKTLKGRMVEIEDELFGWTHSPSHLPEDICVFRNGSKFPVLVSVTHEKDAWVLSERKSRPPGFRKSSLKPEDLFIWDGPYFCRV